jgi:hypothetical protein
VHEVLVAEAWVPATEHWLHELAVANAGDVPPVRSIPWYLGLMTSIAMDFSIGLLPSGFGDALGCTSVVTRPTADRNPHPGIEALRTVMSECSWRFGITTSVAALAETPDRSP